jgi:DNA polymerase-3 subunit gamma/tau
MSYQALYRQWRPLDFDEVIGQSHITVPIKNQIKSKSIGHAYVFSGTRGTGKTSTAKVFARAVNCLNNTDGNPCNQCANCLSILDEQYIDVIEMDAASNNSVDDIRELREHIKFAPSNGNYKVYIIDEVHMLSTGAFNALLKTLEEPPSYILFILATTEVHKIPQTILSRCQRYDFKRVSQQDVYTRLAHICDKLEVSYESEALQLIIRKSDGAVRDSLSSLDQCLSINNNTLKVIDVIEMLGLVEKQQILDLVRYMSRGQSSEALWLIHDILISGKDINQFVSSIIDVYRDLLIVKLIHENHQLLINASQEYIETLIEISKPFTESQITRGINAFIELSRTVKYAQNQRAVLEATMVKVLHPEADTSNDALLERVSKLEQMIQKGIPYVKGGNLSAHTPDVNVKASSLIEQEVTKEEHVNMTRVETKNEEAKVANVISTDLMYETTAVETTTADEKIRVDAIPSNIEAVTLERVQDIWETFYDTVKREKKGIFPALTGAVPVEVVGDKINVLLTKDNKLFVGLLMSQNNLAYMVTLMESLLKQKVTLHFEAAEDKIDHGELTQNNETQVKDFFKEFGNILEIK